MTAVAIALSMASGFGAVASTTLRSAKDENLAATIASKRMADGKEWTTANLNVNTSSSYSEIGRRDGVGMLHDEGVRIASAIKYTCIL